MTSRLVFTYRRPVRVGLCVRHGQFEQLREAIRLTSMLWGGMYNPLIVVDERDTATRLVELFRVDVLYALSDDEETNNFIAAQPGLRWPMSSAPVVRPADEWHSNSSLSLVDVAPALAVLRKAPPLGATSQISGAYPSWRDDDPMADPLLVALGAYPASDLGEKFLTEFTTLFPLGRVPISPCNSLQPELVHGINPLSLTTFELHPERGGLRRSGLYLGDGSDFDDLTTFWNVRASGQDAMFADVRAEVAARQRDFLNAHVQSMAENAAAAKAGRGWRQEIMLWERTERTSPLEFPSGTPTIRHRITDTSWNGLNIKPTNFVGPSTTLAGDVITESGRPVISMQVPANTHAFGSTSSDQFSVLMIRGVSHHGEGADDHTFAAPNISKLNGFYGREMRFAPHGVRVGPDGIGVIMRTGSEFVRLRSVSTRALVAQLFEAFGMKVQLSRAGLVTQRLIKQMGGLQRCRVFKISGVRQLIGDFKANQWFTHSEALRRIGPGFNAYQELYITAREHGKLTPNDAFLFLLDRGVLRAGLEFRCPNCELTFWLSLDDAKLRVDCEYCGVGFNAALQLRDGNSWKYRRSGLFGRDDHQEGGIPVVLCLQRLDTSIVHAAMSELAVYTAGVEVTSNGAGVQNCEIDFVYLTQDSHGCPQLVLGEAKQRSEITAVDVANLRAVAASFPQDQLAVYVAFGKTGSFEREELERCLDVKGTWSNRSIVFTCDELEPYELFDLEGVPEHLRFASSVEALAQVSEARYRPRL